MTRHAKADSRFETSATHLSELIDRVSTEGPQTITRHGAKRAVVLSIEDHAALEAFRPDFEAHLLGAQKSMNSSWNATQMSAAPV